MKLIQGNKDNEKYYSQDFIDGFNLGAKTQYEKDMETTSAKKPKNIRHFNFGNRPVVGECECGNLLFRGFKYCHECGTAIDWSDEE